MFKNLISNFHTHTYLCGHASGTIGDYVEQAQKDGCSALGFSDHCPYPENSGNYWPDIRMTEKQAYTYIEEIKSFAKQSDFPIYTGFECEWDQNYESWYKEVLLGKMGVDYLVLGPHWVTLGNEHLYALEFTTKEQLHKYIDQNIKGIQSGVYKFLAHPDLFMGAWKEWDNEAKACLTALLEAAVDANLPVEINGLGMTRTKIQTKNGIRFQYPYDEFWQMVADSKAKVICNSDAHNPKNVIADARLAREYAKRFGITPLESIF
jgi:histidinol-phosphatase (PHP family)